MLVKLPFCFACFLALAAWFMTQSVSSYAIPYDYENEDCGIDYGVETQELSRYNKFPEYEESYEESEEQNNPKNFYYVGEPDVEESVPKKHMLKKVEYSLYMDDLGPPPLSSGDRPPTWVFEDNEMC